MTEIKDQVEEGLFDNFLPDRLEKGALYHAVTASSIIFIVYIFADIAIDLRRLSVKLYEWELILVILILPLLALIFHLAKKKAGWFIGYFYYAGMSLLGTSSIVNQLVQMRNPSYGSVSWKGMAVVLLAISISAFLLSNPVRKYFRITTLQVTIVSVIAVVTGVVLFNSIR